MADCQSPPRAYDASAHPAHPSTASVAFPMIPSSSFSTSSMSVAARKAALLEKFGGGSNGKPSSSSSASAAYPEPTAFSQPDWTKLIAERKERKDSAATLVSLPPKLTPVPTGSTVATAIDPFTPNVGPKATPPSFTSVSSRVRMAVMAINAIDNSSEGPKWRVGNTEDRPPTALSVSRSWSRMSGATRVGDFDAPLASGSFAEEDDEEDGQRVPRTGKSPLLESIEPPSLSVDTTLSSTSTTSLRTVIDETFDTHPPDMVSPRTGLAYVMLPPWVRRRSSVDLASPVARTPSHSPLKKDAEPLIAESIPEDYEEHTEEPGVVEEPVHPPKFTPTPSPSPSPHPVVQPEPIPRRKPIVLRGQGKKQLPNAVAQRAIHSRTASASSTVRRPISPSSSRRHSVQPTQFWKAPEYLRRSSSVMSCAIVHEDPLVTKAQNKVPLRKVQTKGPKPMRFSMAF